MIELILVTKYLNPEFSTLNEYNNRYILYCILFIFKTMNKTKVPNKSYSFMQFSKMHDEK